MKKRGVLSVLVTAIVFTSGVFAGANIQEIKAVLNTKLNIKVNGQNFVAKETDGTELIPLTYKDRTYLPVRALGEALGVPVDYDTNTNTVLLGTDIEQSLIELDIISGEYRARWADSYKYDTPILIDNLTDWREFLKNHPEQSENVDSLQQNYNDEFFKKHIVYAYVKSETSGSIKLTGVSAELNGDKLNLFMKRISPEVGTSDMATRVCLFEIKRDDIKNVKTVKGIILE